MSVLAAMILLTPILAGATEGKVKLTDLSLEVRVGRLVWPVLDERRADSYEASVRSGELGGGLLRWNMPRADAKLFIKKLKDWAAEAPGGLPFFVAVDHEGGPVFTQEELGTVFPGNMALGATGSLELAEKAARATAAELRDLGIDIDFAPVVDVNSNPSNPIIGIRSFGENPISVAELGAASIRGYLGGGVLPVAKHFPGHGDTSNDSHTSLPTVSYGRQRWEMIDLVPFAAAIRAGVPLVMTAHVAAPALGTGDLPATLSSAALQGVLRGAMGFEGVIVSDSLDMGAIKDAYGAQDAAVRAFSAGCDVLLTGKGDPAPLRTAVVDAVKNGRVSRARLDDSVRRVQRLRPRSDGVKVDAAQTAQRIAEASVTLERDLKRLLPLRPSKDEHVLVLHFDHPMFGPPMEGFAEEVRRRHGATESFSVRGEARGESWEEALGRARKADILLVATHQWGGQMKEAQVSLVRGLVDLGKPLVLLSTLNPYEAGHYPGVGTVVLSYGTTEASLDAVVRLIFGEIPFRGRSPVSIPTVQPW